MSLRRPNILIVLHQEHSTPGRVGRALQGLGARLDIRRPCLGEALPGEMTEHDGVIVFGGPMGVNDECGWLKREIDWIDAPLRSEKPLLGICLGAQMLARKLGARVFTHEDRRGEVGYYPIAPTAAADALCAARFPRHVYHWHFDGFDLPKGAELLAAGDADFPHQAFRYGRAVGLQFHPEVTYHMMNRWTVTGAESLTGPGAQPQGRHLDGWFQHDGAVAEWLLAFLPRWLRGDLGEPRLKRGAKHASPMRNDRQPVPRSWQADAGEVTPAAV